MDALMTALVVGALAAVGDRPTWLAAILADRGRRVGPVIAAAAIALIAAAGLAAVAGALIGPRMTPEARRLLLALALLLQGGGALRPIKPPERLDRWRIGAFATALFGVFILAFGDGVQFVVFALAAGTTLPWLAAIGGAGGTLAVLVAAATLGEAGWRALPLRPARLAIAALFLVTGAIVAMGALSIV